MADVLQLRKSGFNALITLNRPERLNALNADLREALNQAAAEVREDDEIRVVILTGAGRGFCSGADVGGPLPDRGSVPSQNERLDDMGWVGEMATNIYQLGKPVIAVVNGVAAGAGMSLALACDMRVGSADSRFKTVFAERGLSPDSGMSYFLPRIVGYSRAADLIFTSRDVYGEEAYRLGLLDRLTAPEQAMDTALEVAASIAALPPMAIRSGKRVLQQNQDADFHNALRNEMFGLSFARKSPGDQKEQRAAFQEKRKPVFTGT